MEKKLFYAPVEHPRCGDDLEHPWKYAVAPYRVAPHIWQVGGQDDVAAYLLDCGPEGLMLIDTPAVSKRSCSVIGTGTMSTVPAICRK